VPLLWYLKRNYQTKSHLNICLCYFLEVLQLCIFYLSMWFILNSAFACGCLIPVPLVESTSVFFFSLSLSPLSFLFFYLCLEIEPRFFIQLFYQLIWIPNQKDLNFFFAFAYLSVDYTYVALEFPIYINKLLQVSDLYHCPSL
jgi:hypothetical protein